MVTRIYLGLIRSRKSCLKYWQILCRWESIKYMESRLYCPEDGSGHCQPSQYGTTCNLFVSIPYNSSPMYLYSILSSAITLSTSYNGKPGQSTLLYYIFSWGGSHAATIQAGGNCTDEWKQFWFTIFKEELLHSSLA